jgi:outer membrane biogenesis lipoprotein LolB
MRASRLFLPALALVLLGACSSQATSTRKFAEEATQTALRQAMADSAIAGSPVDGAAISAALGEADYRARWDADTSSIYLQVGDEMCSVVVLLDGNRSSTGDVSCQ